MDERDVTGNAVRGMQAALPSITRHTTKQVLLRAPVADNSSFNP